MAKTDAHSPHTTHPTWRLIVFRHHYSYAPACIIHASNLNVWAFRSCRAGATLHLLLLIGAVVVAAWSFSSAVWRCPLAPWQACRCLSLCRIVIELSLIVIIIELANSFGTILRYRYRTIIPYRLSYRYGTIVCRLPFIELPKSFRYDIYRIAVER